jgi:hypothetical protein
MYKRHAICSISLLLILSLTTALAQNQIAGSNEGSAVTIAAASSAEGVRFCAPSSAVHIRLKIYNSTGKKLFDSEVRGGNVLDWHLQDGQTEPLADDSYLCLVTVKSLSGKLTQRIGSIRVEKSTAIVEAIAASQMTAQQTEAIGAVEENASVTVLGEGEAQTPTVIAHNGTEGQLIRGQGALSFRIGDFFSGKDVEQMRLTAEGNLGIGITHPQVRLDVDGLIRASQGIIFPDGTIQYSASSKTLGAKSSRSGEKPGEAQTVQGETPFGTTMSFIPKFLNGAGALTDSVMFESAAGNIGVGTTTPLKKLHVSGGQIAIDNQRFYYSQRTNGNFQEAFGMDSNDDIVFNRNSLVPGVDGDAPKASAGLIFGAGQGRFVDIRNSSNTAMMRLDEATGNVGIGTTSPAEKLSVAGNASLVGTIDSTGQSSKIRFQYDLFGDLPSASTYHGMFAHVHADAKAYYAHAGAWVALANEVHTHAASDIASGILALDRGGTGANLAATGGAGQYLKQTSAGGAVSVGTIAAGDLPSLPYVNEAGDTMTGTLNLPANGLVAGANQLVLAGGNVGIGTTTPTSFTLQVAGSVGPNTDNSANLGSAGLRWNTVFAANGTINTSDARLKQRIRPLPYGLREVMQMRPVTFQWKDGSDARTHLGLLAHEVERVVPEVIVRSPDAAAPLGISYAGLIPLMIKAIQEQQATITALKAENAELKQRNSELEPRNAALDARLTALEQIVQQLRTKAEKPQSLNQ